VKKIPIFNKKTKGLYFLVDKEDYGKCSTIRWYLHPQGYAAYYLNNGTPDHKTILAHRLVLGIEDEKCDHRTRVTHHINKNKLDNRRNNLRIVSQKTNVLDREITIGWGKGYRWHKRDKAFQARICINGIEIHIGNFRTEKEAHEAYVKKAKELIKRR